MAFNIDWPRLRTDAFLFYLSGSPIILHNQSESSELETGKVFARTRVEPCGDCGGGLSFLILWAVPRVSSHSCSDLLPEGFETLFGTKC